MSFKWLDHAFVYGPCLTLCLSEKDFFAAIKHIDPKLSPATDCAPWADPGKAAVHFHTSATGRKCAIVCLDGADEQQPIVIAGLLVHEATHVFQKWCDSVGECTPSKEFQAYSIQWISQQLMWEFARQTQGKAST